MTTWTSSHEGAKKVYVAPVSATGVVGAYKAVTDDKAASCESTVAHGSGGYLVVWKDDYPTQSRRDLLGAMVDNTGARLSKTDITISDDANAQRRPEVDFEGGVFLVVWESQESSTDWDIRGALVNADGSIKKKCLRINDGASMEGDVALASDGKRFLVVYSQHRSGKGDIHGALVNTTGGIDKRFVIARADDEQRSPTLAFGGGVFLVAWQDFRSGQSRDVYGARSRRTARCWTRTGSLSPPSQDIRSSRRWRTTGPGSSWSGRTTREAAPT